MYEHARVTGRKRFEFLSHNDERESQDDNEQAPMTIDVSEEGMIVGCGLGLSLGLTVVDNDQW